MEAQVVELGGRLPFQPHPIRLARRLEADQVHGGGRAAELEGRQAQVGRGRQVGIDGQGDGPHVVPVGPGPGRDDARATGAAFFLPFLPQSASVSPTTQRMALLFPDGWREARTIRRLATPRSTRCSSRTSP